MYSKSDALIWHGRIDDIKDKAHFRNFQVVTVLDATENITERFDVGILGYAVDRGVDLNQGRLGAKDGPNAIREKFGNLPLMNNISIADFGNVATEEKYVEHVQKEFADLIKSTNHCANFHFLIGGGHDIAYAHFKGLKALYPDQSIGVINIDAHFDLREAPHATSGTGFKQILDEDASAGYLVLGLQEAGNTQNLFNIAKQYDVKYVLAEEIETEATNEIISTFVAQYDIIMLTLCLDVIDSAYAPGVSAPCSFGLMPKQVQNLISKIMSYGKTQHISIAEMNPEYDIDDRTAKLVGHIMFHVIHRHPNIV